MAHMSALGHKRTLRCGSGDVRFAPESRHVQHRMSALRDWPTRAKDRAPKRFNDADTQANNRVSAFRL
jgi:hypothetical protein